MYYKPHEILGTDKPVLRERDDNHLTREELIHLNENLEDYKLDAYVPIVVDKQDFFEPVYVKKG